MRSERRELREHINRLRYATHRASLPPHDPDRLYMGVHHSDLVVLMQQQMVAMQEYDRLLNKRLDITMGDD